MRPLRQSRRRPRPPARGFVLVTVLAMLVILALLASTIGVITQRLRDDQLQRQQQFRAEVDMASTEASVLYLLTSQRMTFGGLTVDERMVLSADEKRSQEEGETPVSFMPVGNEIALDGRSYQGVNGIAFSLQDDRGLIAINWTAPAVLQGLLAQGRPADGKPALPSATLLNLLRDYQDDDNLYRLNSAEAEQYRKAGLPPPSNRALSTPLELRRVMHWTRALAFLDDAALAGTVTTSRNAQLNINTAPARVLMSLPGVDAAMATRAIGVRTLRPFLDLTTFYQVLGAVPASEDLLALYPSGSGIIKLWSPDGGAVRVVHWTLTPIDDGGRPWREDYEFDLPQHSQHAGRHDAGVAVATAAAVFAEPAAAPQ